jgi:fumarate reductase flavoprotein subunit
VVEHFIEQAPRELIQLEHWGCPWSREDDGSVAVRAFGGMKKKRTWYAADKSGFHILHTLFQTSLQFPSIKRFDEYFALELLHEDGKCRGVVAMEMRSGRFSSSSPHRWSSWPLAAAARFFRSPPMAQSKPVTAWPWLIAPA